MDTPEEAQVWEHLRLTTEEALKVALERIDNLKRYRDQEDYDMGDPNHDGSGDESRIATGEDYVLLHDAIEDEFPPHVVRALRRALPQ